MSVAANKLSKGPRYPVLAVEGPAATVEFGINSPKFTSPQSFVVQPDVRPF